MPAAPGAPEGGASGGGASPWRGSPRRSRRPPPAGGGGAAPGAETGSGGADAHVTRLEKVGSPAEKGAGSAAETGSGSSGAPYASPTSATATFPSFSATRASSFPSSHTVAPPAKGLAGGPRWCCQAPQSLHALQAVGGPQGPLPPQEPSAEALHQRPGGAVSRQRRRKRPQCCRPRSWPCYAAPDARSRISAQNSFPGWKPRCSKRRPTP